MKIKYNYYSLRFPNNVASICAKVEDELEAKFIDLPFMLPIESEACKYNYADIITFENEDYYVADKNTDVLFRPEASSNSKYFGVINITDNAPKYILWTNFYSLEIERLIADFEGNSHIRVFPNPYRISAILECGDINV